LKQNLILSSLADYSDFGILIKQARDKGIMVPMMGGEGVASPDMYKIAGDAMKDVYYSTSIADVGNTSVGKKWRERYEYKFNKDAQPYAYYGYDAMTVVLKGLEDAIQKNSGKKPTREQVLEAVHAIQNYKGIVTGVSFNDEGDNKLAKIFIHKFENNLFPGPLVSEEGQ
jgi:branched-chain amino acid transport system substrate-binding protein